MLHRMLIASLDATSGSVIAKDEHAGLSFARHLKDRRSTL
jgi:hypothetical protein